MAPKCPFHLDLTADPAGLLHIVHVSALAAGQSAHTRLSIRLAAGVSATLLESHLTLADAEDRGLTNSSLSITLEPGARLTHVRQQQMGPDSLWLARQEVQIAERAAYDGYAIATGGRLARLDARMVLAGAHGFCGLNAAQLVRGAKHSNPAQMTPAQMTPAQMTLASVIRHDGEACETREIVKTIADDHGHGVFQGRIEVGQDGQRTNAHQLAQAILLSDRARADAKPELEIFADDVKCSHGATVGALDEAALFYLEARGLPPEEARALLITAFAREALDSLEHPVLSDRANRQIDRWLADGAQTGAETGAAS